MDTPDANDVTCAGGCCVAFVLPYTAKELQEKIGDPEITPDVKQIAEMVVPITNGTVRRRRKRFGVTTADPVEKDSEGHFYKCSNWDEETRLCGIYEDRPKMCRDYPYARECFVKCGYCAPKEIIKEYNKETEDGSSSNSR